MAESFLRRHQKKICVGGVAAGAALFGVERMDGTVHENKGEESELHNGPSSGVRKIEGVRSVEDVESIDRGMIEPRRERRDAQDHNETVAQWAEKLGDVLGDEFSVTVVSNDHNQTALGVHGSDGASYGRIDFFGESTALQVRWIPPVSIQVERGTFVPAFSFLTVDGEVNAEEVLSMTEYVDEFNDAYQDTGAQAVAEDEGDTGEGEEGKEVGETGLDVEVVDTGAPVADTGAEE